VVVVVGASVVVVVVGVSLVIDEGVSVGDGGLLVGDGVSVTSDVPGFWLAGAGVVLTLGVGVLGALPEVCRKAIVTPAPMAATASAVLIATTRGRRYQASAAATAGWTSRSKSPAGRLDFGVPASSEYSPARIGMMPESSSVSDLASAGAESALEAMSSLVVLSGSF
jgi:hypothetical protein